MIWWGRWFIMCMMLLCHDMKFLGWFLFAFMYIYASHYIYLHQGSKVKKTHSGFYIFPVLDILQFTPQISGIYISLFRCRTTKPRWIMRIVTQKRQQLQRQVPMICECKSLNIYVSYISLWVLWNYIHIPSSGENGKE